MLNIKKIKYLGHFNTSGILNYNRNYTVLVKKENDIIVKFANIYIEMQSINKREENCKSNLR